MGRYEIVFTETVEYEHGMVIFFDGDIEEFDRQFANVKNFNEYSSADELFQDVSKVFSKVAFTRSHMGDTKCIEYVTHDEVEME